MKGKYYEDIRKKERKFGNVVGWFGYTIKKSPDTTESERIQQARATEEQKKLRITINRTLRKCNIPVTKSILSTLIQLYYLQLEDAKNLVHQHVSATSHGVCDYTQTQTPEDNQQSYKNNKSYFQPRYADEIRKTAKCLCQQGMTEQNVEIAQLAITDLIIKQIARNQRTTLANFVYNAQFSNTNA